MKNLILVLLFTLLLSSCSSTVENPVTGKLLAPTSIVGRSIHYQGEDTQIVGYSESSEEYYLSNGETVTYTDIKDSL